MNDEELEVYIKLKYFPVSITDEYYNSLPTEVTDEYKKILTNDLMGGLDKKISHPDVVDYIEKLLFRLLKEYHSKQEPLAHPQDPSYNTQAKEQSK